MVDDLWNGSSVLIIGADLDDCLPLQSDLMIVPRLVVTLQQTNATVCRVMAYAPIRQV